MKENEINNLEELHLKFDKKTERWASLCSKKIFTIFEREAVLLYFYDEYDYRLFLHYVKTRKKTKNDKNVLHQRVALKTWVVCNSDNPIALAAFQKISKISPTEHSRQLLEDLINSGSVSLENMNDAGDLYKRYLKSAFFKSTRIPVSINVEDGVSVVKIHK